MSNIIWEVIFWILSAIMLFAFIRMLYIKFSMLHSGNLIQTTLIDYEEAYNHGGLTFYLFVLRYNVNDGYKRLKSYQRTLRRSKSHLGNIKYCYYNPEKPEYVWIQSNYYMEVSGAFLLLLSLLFVYLGIKIM